MAALDALERGDRRASLGHLGAAIRLDPRTALNVRTAAALASLAGGARGRDAFARARAVGHARSERLAYEPTDVSKV